VRYVKEVLIDQLECQGNYQEIVDSSHGDVVKPVEIEAYAQTLKKENSDIDGVDRRHSGCGYRAQKRERSYK
jgi:hypothetical protein